MKNESKAYYLQVLGLSSNFNETELKDAYRREAKKWHPDLNKDDIYAEERLQLINEAYAFLKGSKNNNSTKRKSSNSYSRNSASKSENNKVWSMTNIFSPIKLILKKLIFYSGGFIAPLFSVIGIVLFSINIINAEAGLFKFLIILILVLGSIAFYRINNFQLNWYKNFGGKLSNEAIRSLAKLWWIFSSIIILITSYILFLDKDQRVLRGEDTNRKVESVKKALYEGIDQCRKRYRNNLSTRFQDAPAFSGNFDEFQIVPVIRNKKGKEITKGKVENLVKRYKPTCFEAKAIPLNTENTWFWINQPKINFFAGYDQKPIERHYTSNTLTRCGDASKPGCKSNEYWWEYGFKGPK
ncbi:DnaJ domain-containing protein [Prochlorococcus marinus]|uniref:DnaJ domain-containing protein n=1 Tax=Prochlorococcus marinus TaxID=1219 RepID=UPI001ADA146E|nr:J domain-containing protein [Prochlorococcus marinus CUG1415]MBW3044045.1 hypothetical protein [Prochlorococcus marinus str. MU1415]